MGFLGRIRDWFYEPKLSAAGSDGVPSYGGSYLAGYGESSTDLVGRQKWITYANAQNKAAIATGLRYFVNLLEGAEWHAEENPAGGAGAKRGVEIIEQGLLRADLEGGKSWPMVVGKAAGFVPFGFSIQATAVGRRPDGMVVYTAIEHRQQASIEKWNRKNERTPFESVTQRTLSGGTYEIKLRECLYCVDHALGDGPDGIGLLRHAMELVRRLERLEILEILAYDSDMGGTPVGYAPLSEIRAAATGTDAAKKAAVDEATKAIRAVLDGRVKNPEKMIWALLDSATFQTLDKQTLSQVRKWAIETLKSNTNGLGNVHEVIKRLELTISRIFGTEFTQMGSDGGAYAMHADKTSMFGTLIHTALMRIGMAATTQLARRLIALNGLDPDTCTPKLVAEPIGNEKIAIVAKALADLAKSNAGYEALCVMHKRMGLPPPEKPTPGDDKAKKPGKSDDKVDDKKKEPAEKKPDDKEVE